MPLSETLLPEFEYEMEGVRRTLERVPEDQFAWRPHPKSFTLGELASHLANIAAWLPTTLSTEVLDFATPEAPKQPAMAASRAELLARFDAAVLEGHAALAQADDDALRATWTLRMAERVVLSMPRIAVIRGFVLKHAVHHRAQLGLYLRMLDIPVPSLYGPSADEQG